MLKLFMLILINMSCKEKDKKIEIKIYSSTKDFLIGLNLQLQKNHFQKSNYSEWFNFFKKTKR